MPLAEKVDEFVIPKKDMEPAEKEEAYHAGTVYIDVVNQDPKLPYWFRQKHPFVFAGDAVVAFSGKHERYGIQLAIAGSRYRREQYQGISIEMSRESLIRIMRKAKEVLDWQDTIAKWHKEENEKKEDAGLP